MEVTEPQTADMLSANSTQLALIESNNGGRGFAVMCVRICAYVIRIIEQGLKRLRRVKINMYVFLQGQLMYKI